MSVQLIIIFLLVLVLAGSILFSASRKTRIALVLTVLIGIIAGVSVWGLLDFNEVAYKFAKEPKLYVFFENGALAAFAGLNKVYTVPDESFVQLNAQITARDFGTLTDRYYKVVMLRPSLFGRVQNARFGEDVFSKEEIMRLLSSPATKQDYARLVMQKRDVEAPEQLMLAINSAFPTNEALKSALLVVLYNAAIRESSVLAEINRQAIAIYPHSFTFFVIAHMPSQLVRGDYFELNG